MRYSTLLLTTVAGVANAGVVTIDAASYAPGTNLSNATPGIIIREITNYGVASGYKLSPVYAVANNTLMDAGPNFIGHNNAKPLVIRYDFRNLMDDGEVCWLSLTCNNGVSGHDFNALYMTFAVPTDLIEMRIHSDEWFMEGSVLRLYNAQRQLIATCYTPSQSTQPPRYGYYPPPGSPACGTYIRSYDCDSTGMHCRREYNLRVTRKIPDIAFALWGGEADSATPVAFTRLTFRRYSDCAP